MLKMIMIDIWINYMCGHDVDTFKRQNKQASMEKITERNTSMPCFTDF